MTEDARCDDAVIDWPAALESAGGDKALMLELVGVFLEEATTQMATIRRSIEQRDIELLHRAAHTLKGSLRIFPTKVASSLAQELESSVREIPDTLKKIDKQTETLPEDRRAIEKQRLMEAHGITPPRLSAAFDEAQKLLGQLEPQMALVIAALKGRLEQQTPG